MGEKEAGPHHPAAPLGGLSVAKFLIDECLHTSLIQLAHSAGHAADHVTYIARGGAKDWQLMDTILERDYTFVTNNRADFLTLYNRAPVHAGLVIIVPNVRRSGSRNFFRRRLTISIRAKSSTPSLRSSTVASESNAANIRCQRNDYSKRGRYLPV